MPIFQIVQKGIKLFTHSNRVWCVYVYLTQ